MTDTQPATLTDRYVHAVVRSLPDRSRSDVANELRALLADDVDARIASGVDAERAIRESIVALGDPAMLAASYSNRPLHLIGPRRYLQWWRLLRLLLVIVIPCAGGGIILAKLLEGAPAGEIALEAFTVLFAVTVHLCFWVTLVFALLERFAPETELAEPWNLDELPEAEPHRASLGWAVVSGAVWLVVVTAAVIAQHVLQPVVTTAGDRAPVLDPALWSWWLPYFFIVWVGEVALAYVAYRRQRWGIAEAAVNIVLAAAFAIPFIVLVAREQLASPELMTLIVELTDASIPGILASLLIAVAIVASLWDAIEGVVRAARAHRARV